MRKISEKKKKKNDPTVKCFCALKSCMHANSIEFLSRSSIFFFNFSLFPFDFFASSFRCLVVFHSVINKFSFFFLFVKCEKIRIYYRVNTFFVCLLLCISFYIFFMSMKMKKKKIVKEKSRGAKMFST